MYGGNPGGERAEAWKLSGEDIRAMLFVHHDSLDECAVEARTETSFARSLRGRNDRSEKVGNRGRIFSIWRCIVVLFTEKSGKYGPILPLSQ